MRRVGIVAVCVLLVLAGCNAAPDGNGESDAETTGTETEVAGTTDASEPGETAGAQATDGTLPPGLSDDGVTDADALAAAHEDALAGRSYTYDREVTVVAADGTELGRWSQRTRVGDERLAFDYAQTGVGVSVAGVTVRNVSVYTDGSVTFWNDSALRDGYRREDRRGFAATTFSSEQLLADVLNATQTTVTAVERGDAGSSSDGETWYRVRAENGSETLTYEPPNGTVEIEATNVTATAVVSPAGLVRNVTYEFDFERGTVSGHRTMEIRYSAIDDTAVEVPAWVDDAKEATNATAER